MKLRLILFLLGAGFARAQFTGAVNGVAGQSFGGTFNGNSATTTSVHHIIDAGWSGLSGAQTFRSTFNSDANSLANSVSASSGAAWAYGGYYSSLALPSFNALGQGFANFYGLCQSLGSFTWPGTAGNACANIRGEAFVAATGGAIWGGTFQVQDTNINYLNAGAVSYAANGMIGLELDTVTTNSGTANSANLYMIDKSSQVSTGFSAYVYGAAVVGNTCGTNGTTACTPHTYGLQFAAGAVTGAGAWFGPSAPTASSSNSMGINVAGRDAGGTLRTGYVGADLNGGILFYAANNGVSTTCAETLGKLGTSGNLRCTDSAGNTQTLGVLYQNTSTVPKTDGSTAIWTAANVLNTTINETSSVNTTITLPTAASVLTAFAASGLSCGTSQTGQSWTTVVNNKSKLYTITINAGTGITISSIWAATSIVIAPGGSSTQTWAITSCVSNTLSVLESANTSQVADLNHAVSLSAQTAGVVATAICTSTYCPAGEYEVQVYLNNHTQATACTTAGSAGVGVTLGWTDATGSGKSLTLPLTGSGIVSNAVPLGTATANYGQYTFVLESSGTANINYTIGYTACTTNGSGAATYDAYLTVHQK